MKKTNQEVETPDEFFRAVERFFRIKFEYDMAANGKNQKTVLYSDDSLDIDWPLDMWIWLNPPFAMQTKFIKKVYKEMNRGAKIISIWPISSDHNQSVTWKKSMVYPIMGRVFTNVRSCMLCRWEIGISGICPLVWDKKDLKYL